MKLQVADFIYLLVEFWTQLSWTLFEGECVLNMLAKQKENPAYEAGDNIDIGDLEKAVKSRFVYFYVFPVVRAIGYLVVMHRLNFAGWKQAVLIATYAGYTVFRKTHVDAVFCVAYLVCFGILLTSYRAKK